MQKEEQKTNHQTIKQYFLSKLPDRDEYTFDEILKALEQTNTYALGDTLARGADSEELKKEYYDFYLFFDDNFGGETEIMEEVLRRWGRMPTCLLIGSRIQLERDSQELARIYGFLKDDQRERVDYIIEYYFDTFFPQEAGCILRMPDSRISYIRYNFPEMAEICSLNSRELRAIELNLMQSVLSRAVLAQGLACTWTKTGGMFTIMNCFDSRNGKTLEDMTKEECVSQILPNAGQLKIDAVHTVFKTLGTDIKNFA